MSDSTSNSNSNSNDPRGDDKADNRDGAQMGYPDVSKSGIADIELARNWALRHIAMVLPGVLVLFVGLVTLLFFNVPLGFITTMIGFVGMFAGYYFALTAKDTSPYHKLKMVVRYYRLRRKFPTGIVESAIMKIHEISHIYRDGTMEMDDGRLEFPIGLRGVNTYGKTTYAKNQLVAQLSAQIDKEVDFRFKYYSTSRREDIDKAASGYEERAVSMKSRDKRWLRAKLMDVAHWLRNDDAPEWDASRWEHYIVVVVDPDEGDVRDDIGNRKSPLEVFVGALNPFTSSHAVEGINTRREVQRKMNERIETVTRNVAGQVEGLEAERLTPDEVACLCLSYWTDERHSPDEELQLAHERTRTGPTIWPDPRKYTTAETQGWKGHHSSDGDPVGNQVAKDRLFGRRDVNNIPDDYASTSIKAAEHAARTELENFADPESDAYGSVERGRTTAFDPSYIAPYEGYMRVGDQYTKTFWLEEMPLYPLSVCFEELFTTPGVDADVCFHIEPENKREVKAEVNTDKNHAKGEGDRLANEGHTDAGGYYSDQEVIEDFDEQLDGSTQSWRINGYVTVRVGPEKVIDDLTDLEPDEYDFESLDAAMMQGLIKESKRMRKILTSGPEHTLPKVPQMSQYDAFRSCGPNSRDVFDDVAPDDLTSRYLGGGVGAIFPPCSAHIYEPEGIDWGRNQHNGLHMRADPFQRGSSPHITTIGKSRSGKTYGCGKAASRWYADAPQDGNPETDRTLIVCDTQSGFDGLTKECDGEHIVIDGDMTINPLEMHPVPEDLLEASGGKEDPFRSQLDSVAQFFVGILDSQGVSNPEDFLSTIEEVLEATYARFGIYPGQPETLENEMPTVEDMIDTLHELGENPERFAYGNADWETAPKVEYASRLLDKLSGFRNDQDEDGEGRIGKYSNFVGESDINLMDDDVDMIYLDLQQFKDAAKTEKAAMLQLMLTIVANKIRTTPGQKMFVIDEAHFLLHSEEMSQWLESAAREWARYEALLWFVSQRPEEFVNVGEDADSSKGKKNEILGQMSTLQIYYCPFVDDKVWRALGLNDYFIDEVSNSLVRGKSGDGFSECIMQFDDREGWFPIYVASSPYEDLVLNYAPRTHGDFASYIRRNTHRLPDRTIEHLPEEARPSRYGTDASSRPRAQTANADD